MCSWILAKAPPVSSVAPMTNFDSRTAISV
jgi:hypothetical protein